jgi:WD40 repeat protein
MRLHVSFIFLISFFGIIGTVDAQYNFNVIRTFSEINHQIVCASYSPDGSFIITAGSDSSLIIWNADRKTIYRTITGLRARPNDALITGDNKYALSGGKDNIVTLWDLTAIPPKIVRTFEGHNGAIKSIDISRDGRMVATGSTDRTVRVWDFQSANLVYELQGHSKDVNCVTFSPDGKTLASGGADGIINLWNMNNGSRIISKPVHKGFVRDLVFSPDGKLLASCGDDKLIYTWQIPGLNKTGTFEGHKDRVQVVDFSPDGKTLISGGWDKMIFLWDVPTQKIILQSEKQKQIIVSLDISPVESDFISSCFESENLETWVLSGLDEAQWIGTHANISRPLISENIIQTNQQKISQDQAINQIPPENKPVKENSMIEIFSPSPVNYKIVYDKNAITLIGKVNDPEGINTFLINKIPVTLSDEGVFQTTISLIKGENPVNLIATNKKNKMSEMNITVICTSEALVVQESQKTDLLKSKYYALLMAVNDYQSNEIPDLDNPIKDADKLYNVLLSDYTFEKENVRLLKNPELKDIISALDELSKTLTPNDNLLIFYAGHGYWDKKGNVGYWFPADAAKGSSVNWFRNSTLRDFIGSIQARHTILIADACFSGAIFKTRAAFSETPQGIQKLYELPSRKAMTSGIMEVVPDESMFLKYLVERLTQNKEKYLPSELLFSNFKSAVMNNSPNVPQYGVIQNVGDEGGDFIFIKK